ncbi:acyl-CoA dehydrogenase [Sulfitobacter sp. JBTF-M27]|uniref:3-methylmercaptopropionyl-CoA dehydrogenase n=1 Tax=Sulfitobacter sediminilitoris TaxID=2698830 RepID=A0A6P0CBP0_9RHOB|nr:acyl-CoA dehydrogenase [Sulfitobacter sediminilitoris]NEK22566.1 acyl-CoA dehydrogenase [Sulfitobacter sediminilitoris]
MPYRAAVDEFSFMFDHLLDAPALRKTEKFAEATSDVTNAILSEAGKLCDEVLAPLQRAGDLHPARLENGVVRTSPGFDEGWKAIAEGGWIGMSADPEYGGMGLPMILTSAVNEMMSGACLSLQLAPLMGQGQIEALEHHASDEIKALYLPKLISGEWTGTMNLTEPQAGSDVGALKTKAEANGDGTYNISGQKIYITWGDHDLAENVCHLVLARLPDAPEGTKGISLFIVPKFVPNEDGSVGPRNGVTTVSLEHKMGIHGSPTAVLQYENARGWLIGPEQGGMAAMFTMMNNARLGVGGQGIGVAEAAFQHAMAYALERKQGKSIHGFTIAAHADVRRMLMTMKADVFAARAIALSCAMAIDMEEATGDAGWAARAAFFTPIAKAFGTEVGIRVADIGIQVHGGMGFVEETGAAQFLRDVRVTAIYEGTNGIQAMDLVARKMMDGGEMASRILDEIEEGAEAARADLPEMAEAVWQASETLRETTDWLISRDDLTDRFAGAVPYLNSFARVLGAHFHLQAAMADQGGPREKLARFYVNRLLPEHAALLETVRIGQDDLYAMDLDELSA